MVQTRLMFSMCAGVLLLPMTASTIAQQENQDESEEGQAPYHEEQHIEEVIVTGSRIPRTGFESLQPTTVVDRVAIDARANLNVAETLRELPNVSQGRSPVGNQPLPGTGQNTVGLYGFGPSRTLTLVNGHRFPPSTNEGLQVDYNALPSAMVERVEMIAIGGAPVYGSDAIAGTVNVILRDDFDGLEYSGSYGQSLEYSDAEETEFGLVWGIPFAANRGNLTLTAGYNTVNSLHALDRPATATVQRFVPPADPNSPFDFELVDDFVLATAPRGVTPIFFGFQFFFPVFGNGIPLVLSDPASPFAAFDQEGGLVPFELGEPTGSPIVTNGGDGFRAAEVSGLLADLERSNVNAFLNYDLSDQVSLNAEAWFSRTDAEQPVFEAIPNSVVFGGLPADGYGRVNSGPIPILIDNPYLPETSRNTILAALNLFQDFNGDGQADPTIDTNGDGIPDEVGFWTTGDLSNVVGDNPYGSEQDTMRLLLGLEGELELAKQPFSWDVTYTWGEVQSDNTSIDILQGNFEKAIQVTTDSSGNPVCVDPSGGCVPLNVVGRASPEAIAYVSTTVTDRLTLSQQVLTANIAGDVLDLPAGPLAIAAGAAFREEESRYQPDARVLSGETRFSRVASGGSFDTREIYIETLVPLLGGELDTPGVHLLEFEGAYRLVDNSVTGTDPTWTAGLRYRPIETVELRGNFTQSIRAPSLVELFRPETVIFQNAADPCDFRFIGGGNVPDRRATNCAADGIVQPFQSFVVNAGQQGIGSGNEDLRNEVADAYTFGLVLQPEFAEGLVIAIDYLDFTIKDAISFLSLDEVMNGCYDSAAFPDEPLCDNFSRDSMNQVADFRVGYENVDEIRSRGIQTIASYQFGLERYGDLRLDVNYYRGIEGTIVRGENNPINVDGTIGFSRDKLTLSALWSIDDWGFYAQGRYLGSAVFSDDEFTRDPRGVGSWTVFNTSVSYALNEKSLLQLNIDNLFDEGAPYPALASPRGLGPYFQGVLGRTVRLSVRAGF